VKELIMENEVGQGFILSTRRNAIVWTEVNDPYDQTHRPRPQIHYAIVETPEVKLSLGAHPDKKVAEGWVREWLSNPEYRSRHGRIMPR
jgi:hypothetical protein